jgi:hypothetical protein
VAFPQLRRPRDRRRRKPPANALLGPTLALVEHAVEARDRRPLADLRPKAINRVYQSLWLARDTIIPIFKEISKEKKSRLGIRCTYWGWSLCNGCHRIPISRGRLSWQLFVGHCQAGRPALARILL